MYLAPGLLSGTLHALSGPDHLAALLPVVFGKAWHVSASIGAIWGIGHGVSTALMGVCAYLLRESVVPSDSVLRSITGWTDFFAAVTLMIIGLVGIREAKTMLRELRESDGATKEDHTHLSDIIVDLECNSSFSQPNSSNASIEGSIEGSTGGDAPPRQQTQGVETCSAAADEATHSQKRYACTDIICKALPVTIMVNGILLGLSWDGLPSLAPALAATSLPELSVFLGAYAVGTATSIGTACAVVGECTRRLGRITNDTLPANLAFATSVWALIIGVYWGMHSCYTLYYSNTTQSEMNSYESSIGSLHSWLLPDNDGTGGSSGEGNGNGMDDGSGVGSLFYTIYRPFLQLTKVGADFGELFGEGPENDGNAHVHTTSPLTLELGAMAMTISSALPTLHSLLAVAGCVVLVGLIVATTLSDLGVSISLFSLVLTKGLQCTYWLNAQCRRLLGCVRRRCGPTALLAKDRAHTV